MTIKEFIESGIYITNGIRLSICVLTNVHVVTGKLEVLFLEDKYSMRKLDPSTIPSHIYELKFKGMSIWDDEIHIYCC